MSEKTHILVLDGYGLIGREITAACLAAGHRVTGAGRSPETGRRLIPDARWIGIDLNEATLAAHWQPHLAGIDIVINASGALQSGGGDDLAKIQRDAIRALTIACEKKGIKTFVQFSAPGAAPGAATEYMATKGAADETLRASSLDWVILKPGLVIAPTAYGGTSLLRTLAAIHWVQPVILGDAQVQTVAVADVARSALRAATDPALARQAFDLVEPDPHTLADIILAFRRWLGFGEAPLVPLPAIFGKATARLADLAGRLGWRPPLRSTSLAVLEAGVTADPDPWRRANGETLSPLSETLARIPATRQERQYASTQLLFPVPAVLFALVWIASGLIGLWRLDAAAAIVTDALGPTLARTSVVLGAPRRHRDRRGPPRPPRLPARLPCRNRTFPRLPRARHDPHAWPLGRSPRPPRQDRPRHRDGRPPPRPRRGPVMVEIEPVLVLRWLHVVGATVLLGTGAGIAFFMVMAHRTGDPHLIAQTAGTVVIAD